MLLDELAEQLVDVTSSLVGGRIINIMNPEGIIIASTERNRIGSYHQGAREAVRTGKVVNIRKDQLDCYPGAKEGCNMPLRVNGTIIGVVGIYGDPEQIQDVAHLLEVYAAKYYQLEAMLHPRLSESMLRSRLLMQLLSPINNGLSAAYSLMETLNIRFSFPVYTLVISCVKGLALPENANRICEELEQMGFMCRSCDVWGIVEQRLVLLCSDNGRDFKQLKALTERGYRVSIGEPCASLLDIQRTYNQASLLDISCNDSYNDIESVWARCACMMASAAKENETFLAGLADRLKNNFGDEEAGVMMQSIKAYYDCERSVSSAAKREFIHKNTLQYRVKRVLEVLGIEKQPAFWQEYIVRLLIEYIYRNLRP